MQPELRRFIDSLLEGNLVEANPYFKKIMAQKATRDLDKKKKGVFDNGQLGLAGNGNDSSGNNDLCDSSDFKSGISNSSAVSEQNAATNVAPPSYIGRMKRDIGFIHPHNVRNDLLNKAEKTEKRLTQLGKKKTFE